MARLCVLVVCTRPIDHFLLRLSVRLLSDGCGVSGWHVLVERLEGRRRVVVGGQIQHIVQDILGS